MDRPEARALEDHRRRVRACEDRAGDLAAALVRSHDVPAPVALEARLAAGAAAADAIRPGRPK